MNEECESSAYKSFSQESSNQPPFGILPTAVTGQREREALVSCAKAAKTKQVTGERELEKEKETAV